MDNPATGVPMAKSLALGLVDLEGDGDVDVMVANDTVPNFLFLNQGDGTFVEAAEDVGVAYDRDGQATGAMGVDAGYYRNDQTTGHQWLRVRLEGCLIWCLTILKSDP